MQRVVLLGIAFLGIFVLSPLSVYDAYLYWFSGGARDLYARGLYIEAVTLVLLPALLALSAWFSVFNSIGDLVRSAQEEQELAALEEFMQSQKRRRISSDVSRVPPRTAPPDIPPIDEPGRGWGAKPKHTWKKGDQS